MANTSITVAIARANLYQYYTPNDQNSAKFLSGLNLVCERYVNSGKWKGNVLDCVFDASTGYITLPYEMQSILAVQVRHVPEVVFGEFAEYVITGPGKLKPDMQNQGILVDFGADVPSMVSPDPDNPCTLKLTIAKPADAGKTMRVYGTYPNGDEFMDAQGNRGIDITSVYPTTTTTLVAKTLTAVELPEGRIDNWYLYGTVDGTDTLLSRYYPFESIPNYKRYITQTIQESASSNIRPTIGLKCMRRATPMIAETDLVWPGHLGALKFGLMALKDEDNGYDDSAMQKWGNGYNLLDQWTRASRGSAQMPIPFAPFGPGNRTLINSW